MSEDTVIVIHNSLSEAEQTIVLPVDVRHQLLNNQITEIVLQSSKENSTGNYILDEVRMLEPRAVLLKYDDSLGLQETVIKTEKSEDIQEQVFDSFPDQSVTDEQESKDLQQDLLAEQNPSTSTNLDLNWPTGNVHANTETDEGNSGSNMSCLKYEPHTRVFSSDRTVNQVPVRHLCLSYGPDGARQLASTVSKLNVKASKLPSMSLSRSTDTSVKTLSLNDYPDISPFNRSEYQRAFHQTVGTKNPKRDEKLPFVCTFCNKSFKLRVSRDIHALSHTHSLLFKTRSPTPGSYYCPLCHSKVKKKCQLTDHMTKEHNAETVYSCRHCRFSTLNSVDLALHYETKEHKHAVDEERRKSATRPKSWLCNICGADFYRKQELESHLDSHKDPSNKDIPCPHCDFEAVSKLQLSKHMEKHSTKVFTCSTCPYTTNRLYCLRQHSASHLVLDKRRYHCQDCDAKFDKMHDLRFHVKTTHITSCQDSFFCKYCSFVCDSPSKLENHLFLVHQSQGKHKCDVCYYRCNSPKILEMHKAKHKKDRPFKCPHCPMAFGTEKTLKGHEQRHLNIKKFLCTECPYKCVSRTELYRHMLRHYGLEKEYTCPECDYKTKRSGNLTKHMRTHDSVKHFPCPHCKYRSRLKQNLKRHMQRVHQIEREVERTVPVRIVDETRQSVVQTVEKDTSSNSPHVSFAVEMK